eukprot:CAMPEP_0172668806 /NCGR_PEP_ID=MMETSP1074-20121228/9288_1 /TAXON_ID=2916 /ORGANISM="Ceratium fusus, Strain PA161109" /LENGTH=135 /DNA_ID=CAMNT_0013485495 /DNA_START=235 /DNA_END=639 /DNA_ORIENTATION=+
MQASRAAGSNSSSNSSRTSPLVTEQQQQPLLLNLELLLPPQCMLTSRCKVVLFVTLAAASGEISQEAENSIRCTAGRIFWAGPLDTKLEFACGSLQPRLKGRSGPYLTIDTDDPVIYTNLLRLIFAFVVVLLDIP